MYKYSCSTNYYFCTDQIFYSKYIANSINRLNVVIQNLKNNDIDCKEHQTNITEFNHIIHEVENIHNYLSDSIKDQLTIQNNFKKKLKIFEHDLKTPLTVLQGHVELLKKMNNSNLFTEEITSKINKETDIALNSISRINKQLQIHINNINLLPNHTDIISVAKVISMISESYNHPYILKNKTPDIEIDKHFPYHQIFINNQVLYHVIDNLISNALKYANNQIILKFEMVNAHLLNFVVLNDGKTFSEEELHSAKEWGVKGRESNGSGISLYFANEVIKQYNSEIHLNNVNQHTQVSFTIAV